MTPVHAHWKNGWTTQQGRRGGEYHFTFTSPLWPHGGRPGAALYVKVTGAHGWMILEKGEADTSLLREVTFAEALAALPPELRERATEVHVEATRAVGNAALKWQNRWLKMRREAKAVVQPSTAERSTKKTPSAAPGSAPAASQR